MKVAVIGAGVVGLSATMELLSLGADVTCYEAATPMSQRSGGASRIFRLAHSTPELVRTAIDSGKEFKKWEEVSGNTLIRRNEVVMNGVEVDDWASAMSDAGARHSVVDSTSDRLRLPTSSIPGPLLIDHAGGVLDVARIRAFLSSASSPAIVTDQVYGVTPKAKGVTVSSANSPHDYDYVLISAGAGTCALAAQAGLYTASGLAHHVRFTFPLRDHDSIPQCLLEKSESWKAGFSTYQHMSGPGEWAVGAHIDPSKSAWELGPEKVISNSRELIIDYVRTNLDGVEARVLGELYCTITPGLGDGVHITQNDSSLAIYGENLFKLAPILGKRLAEMILKGPVS